MKQDKIVLIDKELIIREDITLHDLRMKFPEVFRRITETMFAVEPDYTLNGVVHLIPKTFIKAVGNQPGYWSLASLEDYFTFNFIPERDYTLTNVYYRRYNPDTPFSARGPYQRLRDSDRLHFDELPGLGIEFCQHRDRNGLMDEICNFYSIVEPKRILLIPMS